MRLSDARLDLIAGAYVLGISSLRVRRRFEALVARDPAARAALQFWTERLVGLGGWVPPVRPLPETWPRILARLPAERGTAPPRPARRPRQGLAALLVVAGLALGGFIYYTGVQVAMSARVTSASGQPLWQFDAPRDAHTLKVSVLAAGVVPPNRSYEIWALPPGPGRAVSLGLVPLAGNIELRLAEAQRAALRSAHGIAISVEPLGGSPTGVATGAVIYVVELKRRG